MAACAKAIDRHTEVLAAVRKTIGPDVTLMVDVQYLWEDAATCLSMIRDWAEFDCYFLETPIWSDNVARDGEARRAAPRCRSPSASGWPRASSSRS